MIDQDKSRLTENEMEDAKAILRILPHVDTIERMKNGLLFCSDMETGQIIINGNLFPSIRPRWAVTLTDIIKENEK